MTRINCVPPSELHDKHLVAEYRELPRIFRLARHASDAPKQYVLGTGHMKFFFDKLQYLYERQLELCAEMRKRNITVNFPAEQLLVSYKDKLPANLWNDWEPTPEAMMLNRQRLVERMNSYYANALKVTQPNYY